MMIRTVETLSRKMIEKWKEKAKEEDAIEAWQWMSLAWRLKCQRNLEQSDLVRVLLFLKENDGHPNLIKSFEAILSEEVMVCKKKI